MSPVHEQCLGLPARGLQHEVRPGPIEQLRGSVDQFFLPPACPQVDDLISRLSLGHGSHLCAKLAPFVYSEYSKYVYTTSLQSSEAVWDVSRRYPAGHSSAARVLSSADGVNAG
jgi:hypothetical protein